MHVWILSGLALLFTIKMYLTCPCLANVYLQDYPSVGQLAMQLEKHNIQPIFAVTSEVADVYKVNLHKKLISIGLFLQPLYSLMN